MALTPIELDDLTWSQMTDAIRGRIAALSGGRWTLHSPVDPGVTLLDLYAARLEDRLFWMDQPSESVQRAFLRLLGIEPYSTVAATTVMVFTSIPEGNDPNIPADTRLTLEDSLKNTTPRVFTAHDDVTFVPASFASSGRFDEKPPTSGVELECDGMAIVIGGTSGEVCLFSSDGARREARLTLWLTEPLTATTAGGTLSLLFDLVTPEGMHPQWVPQAVDAEAPMTLSWSFANADGSRLEIADDAVQDGTGGMRRSGIVRLTLPDPIDQWQATPSDDGVQHGYTLVIERADDSSTYSPRVRRIMPNAVAAVHRRPADLTNHITSLHKQLRGWARYPGTPYVIELPESQRPPIVVSVSTDDDASTCDAHDASGDQDTSFSLELRENGEWYAWEPMDDLAFAGPADRRLVVDRTRGELRFGDGLTGRRPMPDVPADENDEVIRLRYDVGGGDEGNLGAMRWWRGGGQAARCAFNPVPATGGEEPESIPDALDRASTELRSVRRTVTRADFEELAVNTPGVSIRRAHAVIGRHPDLPCMLAPGAITVFIVPGLPDSLLDPIDACDDDLTALRVDEGALETVRRHLDRKRLVTQEVHVLPARFVGVEVKVEFEGVGEATGDLRQDVERALRTYLHPLRGFDGFGWPFGEPVRPSALLRAVQSAIGDELRVGRVGIRTEDTNGFEWCEDVEIGDEALVALRRVSVRFARDQQFVLETLR